MKFIGLDAGSVSVKLVILDNKGDMLFKHYERHKGYPLHVSLRLLKKVTGQEGHKAEGPLMDPVVSSPHDFSLSVTGSAGRLIASVLGIKPVNEIVAQAYSTKILFPRIKTIIEMGGEDSKLIYLGEGSRSVQDFSMNKI